MGLSQAKDVTCLSTVHNYETLIWHLVGWGEGKVDSIIWAELSFQQCAEKEYKDKSTDIITQETWWLKSSAKNQTEQALYLLNQSQRLLYQSTLFCLI